VFPASRPSRGVLSCVALGLPGHPPKGVVPSYPPNGVLRDCSRPVPGSCRGIVSPLTGGSPHKGDKLHQKAASMVTEQPGRLFAVDWRATKNLYQELKTKFVQNDADGATASGSAGEVFEMDTRMSDVCSEMDDTTLRADKEKEEAGKADEALMRAGQDARRWCLGLRAKRAGQGSTDAKNDD